jgi:hypothetical protein
LTPPPSHRAKRNAKSPKPPETLVRVHLVKASSPIIEKLGRLVEMMRQPKGWPTKDGALELLSLSLNNSKGFSKKAMNFSEFQAFRMTLPLVWPTMPLNPDLGTISLSPEVFPRPWTAGEKSLCRSGRKSRSSDGCCEVKTWSGFCREPGGVRPAFVGGRAKAAPPDGRSRRDFPRMAAPRRPGGGAGCSAPRL